MPIIPGTNTLIEHWRYSQRIPRFFALDARVFLVILFALLHIRPWTLMVVGFVIFAFWVLEQRGLTFESALRACRFWVLGRKRPALARQRHSPIDYGAVVAEKN